MKKSILILATLLTAGCEDRSQMTQPELIDDLSLPPNVQNVKLLNPPWGSWHTFELVVDGQTIKVLRHYTCGDAGTESSIVIPQR